MGDMPIAISCKNGHKPVVKMLSELEVIGGVTCPVCESVTNLSTPPWSTTLLDARKAADEFDPKPGQ